MQKLKKSIFFYYREWVLLAGLLLWLGADIPDLNNFPPGFHPFQPHIRLSKEEVRKIEEGRAVLRVLNMEAKSELAVIGIIRINVPYEYFLQRFRDIATFERGTSMPQTGVFSTPPKLDDLKTLKLDSEDLKEIKGCKEGSCEVKLSADAIQRMQKEGNWSDPKYEEQANQVFRKMILQLVQGYAQLGNKGMAPLQDRKKVTPSAAEFQALLEASSYIKEYVPELHQYLLEYPNAKLPDSEDVLYWSVAEFGFKPTLRVNHLMIYKHKTEQGDVVVIASKQLYATHYFRTALELRFLVPLKNPADGFYLIWLNRSRVDGLEGLFGGIKKAFIAKKTVKSLTSYLDNRKHSLEEQYAKSKSK